MVDDPKGKFRSVDFRSGRNIDELWRISTPWGTVLTAEENYGDDTMLLIKTVQE
ncbi:MAG: hypothetical protein R2728_10315 [Chitinophagales bacterium]